VWFLLFIVVVLFLWWRLAVSARDMKQEVKAIEVSGDDHDGEHEGGGEPEVETAAVVEAEPAAPDDLTVVEGIGPKISSLLQGAGIVTHAQLADADAERLDQIVDEAGLRMADVSTWSEQAGLASEGKWDELQELQDQLKGGRVE
jgi:predicted flap endonuclease-1-like 5' DNA nuclease